MKSTFGMKLKEPMIGEPDDDEDREVLTIGHERLRDRAAASEMAEPERIVTVDQNAETGVRH